jgi:benzoylformate decarboxylase
MTPVQALLEVIRSEGVDRVFGNPGTTELPFIDALVDAPDLEYVLGLHEGSVVAMADGYARATRRPSLVNLHVAAGVANGLIGMLNARRSRTPMVVTAGQQDRRHLLHDPMLAGDVVGLARAATKSATEVQHVHDLPLVLRRAFAEAVRTPAGPVLVSIPMDVLDEEVQVTVPARSAAVEQPVAGGIAAAAKRLEGARCPVVIAGDGVGRDGAIADLVAVAEALGAVVYHQPMADGINFPGTHPLYRGMIGPTYAEIRQRLAPHDIVVIVGAQAFLAHHYTPDEPLPPGITVVQIDSDPGAIGRTVPVDIGLAGAISPTLADLARRLRQRVKGAGVRLRKFTEESDVLRAGREEEALARYGETPMHPLAAVHAIANNLPGEAIVVEEAITSGILLRQVLRQDKPGSYVHTVGGGLGWGIGAAVGTKLGAPERPVVAVLGDGCATFGLQGLWSAARYGVPVAFLVMDNGEYRTLKDTLDRRKSRSTAQGRYVGLDLRPPELDWSAAGRTFGVPVVTPTSCGELAHVVAGLGDLDGPLLVQVRISGHGGS